jgi:hypothetical protein
MYHVERPPKACRSPSGRLQKDAASPRSRPTAGTLYYSKDVTPGQTFEYNKDPNGTIYAIVRARPDDGSRAPRSVSVPAARSRRAGVSRRQDARLRAPRGHGSELFLRDLATGRECELFDNVDKDLQEAWAVHGVYPQYAWTPDGRSIVIWGEGKIWRVDVAATGTGTQIPFTARVEQTVQRGRALSGRVAPDEFPVRMLRDVRVSPDGRWSSTAPSATCTCAAADR